VSAVLIVYARNSFIDTIARPNPILALHTPCGLRDRLPFADSTGVFVKARASLSKVAVVDISFNPARLTAQIAKPRTLISCY
jgi:hypothetical protein